MRLVPGPAPSSPSLRSRGEVPFTSRAAHAPGLWTPSSETPQDLFPHCSFSPHRPLLITAQHYGVCSAVLRAANPLHLSPCRPPPPLVTQTSKTQALLTWGLGQDSELAAIRSVTQACVCCAGGVLPGRGSVALVRVSFPKGRSPGTPTAFLLHAKLY